MRLLLSVVLCFFGLLFFNGCGDTNKETAETVETPKDTTKTKSIKQDSVTTNKPVKDTTKNTLPVIEMKVDLALLEEEIVNPTLNIAFRIPKGWGVVPENDVRKLLQIDDLSSVTGSEIYFQPLYVFASKDLNQLLAIYAVTPRKKMAFKDIAVKYQEYMKSLFKNANVSYSEFVSKNILFLQHSAFSENVRSIKAAFSNGKGGFFQFNYYIPDSAFAKTAPVIESSLGSLRLLK